MRGLLIVGTVLVNVAGMVGTLSAQTTPAVGTGEIEETTVANTDRGSDWNFSVSGRLTHQLETSTDASGDFSLTRFRTGLGAQTDLSRDFQVGLRFNYGLDLYDFSGNPFGGTLPGEPWDDIHTLGAGAIFSLDFSDDWTGFGGPVTQFARESGASWGDSWIAGGVLGVSHRFSSDLTLGGGVVVTSQLEDSVRIVPMFVIDWHIANDLRLSSQTSGETVRSGVELVYEAGRGWEFALGAANQFTRFRLDDEGIAPDGVGEDENYPIWLRATYQPSSQLRFDAQAGVTTFGELQIDDEDGDRLSKQEYDPTLFLGLFVNFRF